MYSILSCLILARVLTLRGFGAASVDDVGNELFVPKKDRNEDHIELFIAVN